MLKTIIAGGKGAKLLLIEDESSARGEDLFKAILMRDIANDGIKKIHLFCMENPPEHYLKGAEHPKIIRHNLFEHPLSVIIEKRDYKCRINEILQCGDSTDSSLFIDSLNMIYFIDELDSFFGFLHKVKEKYHKVVSIMHGDAIEDAKVLRKIKFLSDIILEISTEKVEMSYTLKNSRKSNRTVELLHKKNNGKMFRQKETFSITADQICSEAIPKERNTKNNENLKEIMKSLTTFRLGLDMAESEKIARNNLVLPYLRNECKEEGGQIIYYAEAEDDLEEDPDDDLDI